MNEEAILGRIYASASPSEPPVKKKSKWNHLKWLLLIPLFLVQFYAIQLAGAPTNPYSPLGDYSIRQVLNRLPDSVGPSLRVGDVLKSEGTKCNDSSETISIKGNKFWQLVDPRGTTYPDGSGVALREPGCELTAFEYIMPDKVIARSEQLFAQGYEFVVWRVTGSETPTDKANGVTKTWASVDFKIYPLK